MSNARFGRGQGCASVSKWLDGIVIRLIDVPRTSDTEPVMDVILVHGLDGDCRTTWQLDDKDPEKFWPQWMADDLPQLRFWSVGYAASSSRHRGNSMPLTERASSIMAYLRSSELGDRPLCWVGHSLGGLLVKQILRTATTSRLGFEQFARNTRGVVFLSTPHNGAALAEAAKVLGMFYRASPVMSDLGRDDPHLRDLNDWFRNWADEQGVGAVVMYEKEKTFGVLVVREGSANPGLVRCMPIPVDANHITIAKPPNRDAPVYRELRRFLRLTAVQEGGPSPPAELDLVLDKAEQRSLDRLIVRMPSAVSADDLFHLSTGYRYPAEHPRDISECVYRLRDLLDPWYLFAFAEHLAIRCDDTLRSELRAWIDRTAPRWSVNLGQLHDLRNSVQRDVALARPHAVIEIRPDTVHPARYRVVGWHCAAGMSTRLNGHASRLLPRTGIEAEATEVLAAVGDARGQLVVFQVPVPMLADPFEDWVSRSPLLSAETAVAVRPLRSEAAGHSEQIRLWQFAAGTTRYVPDAIQWLGPPDSGSNPPGAACLGITDAAAGPVTVAAEIARTGIPIAVWHRTYPTDRRRALELVLQSTALSDLPAVVRRFRAAAHAENAPPDHPGRGLVLLWDDPTCGAGAPFRMRQPKEAWR